MSLDYVDAAKLITKAREEMLEEKLFNRWVADFHTQESYEDFKARIIKRKDERTSDEILKEVSDIIKMFKFEPGGE